MKNLLMMFAVLICTSFSSRSLPLKIKYSPITEPLDIYRMRDNRLKNINQKKINEIIETQNKIIEL
jgi:hypothetical protein